MLALLFGACVAREDPVRSSDTRPSDGDDRGDEARADDDEDADDAADAGERFDASFPRLDASRARDARSADDAQTPDVPDATLVPLPGVGDPTFPLLGTDSIDVTHYDLAFRWDPKTHHLEAEARLSLRTREPLTALSLDFAEPLEVSEAYVAIGGDSERASDTTHAAEKLLVPLARTVPADTELALRIVYAGTPEEDLSVESAPVPVGWLVDGEGAVATLSEPDAAHSWYPANDHPTDKATFRTAITVPSGLVAVGNGVAQGAPVDNRDGTVTYTWAMAQPMAPYLALVAIDDFAAVDQGTSEGVALRNYLPTGRERSYAVALSGQPAMLSYLGEKLGPYPFREYGSVVVPGETTVALETQGRSLFQGASAQSPATVMHELAHQWFGNSVSVTRWQEDIWWVEGFAHFAEWLWAEETRGARSYHQTAASEYEQLSRQARVPLGSTTKRTLFDPSVYTAGALVFYQLRAALGDDLFFESVRTFLERHRYGNATAEALFATFADVAGRDVEPSVHGWFVKGALPPITFPR